MAIQFLSSVSITGTTSVSSIANDNSSYTGILVWDGGNLKYRTKSQILSDIGATGNTGTVTSVTVQGTTGLSGSGTVTTSGTITLTNSDRGSSQSIYKNVAADSGGTATANSNNDTLTISGGSNVTTARSGDTITINATDTTTNNFVSSLSWNTGTGVLTAARSGLSSLTVDLDGRYVTSSGVTSVATTFPVQGGTITSSGTISVQTPQSGDWWNGGVAIVATDGVMEIGKYIDMHASDTATSDFDIRLTATTGTLNVSGDIEINGGDIILGGTGRIQGVDTVSSGTDAANKTYVDNAVAGVPQGDITNVSTTSPITGGGSSGSVTIAHANSGVTAGSYARATVTVDATGHVTSISANSDAQGVTSVATGNGISGGTITSTGTLTVGAGDGLSQSSTGLLVDSTVVRTSGTQSIGGVKTFTSNTTFNGYLRGSGQQLVLNAGESSGQATGQTNELVYLNAESGIQINSSPDNWSSGWAGRKTTTINDSSGNSTFANDITVSGGDITLGGTGRIQGVDTVSSGTDAANKTYVDNAISGVPQGDITAVVAGTGLSGGGTSGSVTLNNTITNNNQLSNGSGYITASSTNTLTNKSGNISQWTNDSGYVTSSGGSMSSWKITADSGGTATIDNAETVDIAGGTNITTSRSSNTITITNGITNNNQLTNGAGYTTNVGDITGVTAGTNLTGGGTSGSVTLNMATGGVGSGTYGSTSNSTKIDTITVDAYGRVTAVATGGTGQVNTISSGNTNTLTSSGSTTVTLTPVTGTVNSSSSKLATGAQIQTAINSAVTGVLKYDGVWNASTNSPTLSSGSGTVGEYYIVSVAGSTNLDGITDWAVGDWAVFSDQATDAWQKIDNTQVGNVTGSGSNTRLAVWNSASNITSDSGLTFNTSTNLLTIGGQVNWSGGSSAESNSAYDNMITAFSDSGSSTITLTLTQNDGGTLTTSFSNPQGTTTPSNTQTFTNKSGNISQWTNNSGYITSSSVGNGQINGATSGNGLSGSMSATANQSGNSTFTVTSNATTAATASTIAYRDSSADLNVRLLRANYANQSTISGAIAFRVNNSTDNYTRYCSSPSAIRTFIGAASSSVVSGVTSVATGSGLTGGTITSTGTLSHADTSSQGSVNNSGVTYIQDVSLDGFGHVTSLTSSTATLAGLGYTGATNANYITNNNQLTNGAGYTTNTGTTTASNSQTFTNKGGNISQWTNDSGYTTNAGTMTGFGVAAAVGGSSFTISNGETLSLVGGTNITASFNSSNESITFNNDITNNNQLTNGAGYVTSSGGSMSTWVLKEGNGTETSTVSNGETVTFAQGSGIQTELTSTSSGGTLTITNTRTEITNNNQLTNGAGYTTNTGTTTASNSQTFTNKSGSISQWTNDAGYLTSAGSMSSWTLTADSGGSETISNLESVDIAGGTNITTVRSGATVTINNGITNNNQLTNGAGYTTAVGDITNVTAGAGLSGGGASGSVSVAVDYLGSDSIIKAAPTASGSATTGDFILIANDTGNVFETPLSNLPFSNNSGDITAVSAGTGMSGGGTSGSVTLNCTITNNNQLTNGAGYTTNTGDITGVTAGSGLTGGGSSGGVTLNVDYGTGGLINDAPSGSGTPDVDDELLIATSSSGTGATVKYVLGDLPFLASSNAATTNFTVNSTLNVRGVIDLADNDILRFGTGDDVEMFFSGSDMFMDINNGEDFKIRDGNSGNATRFTFDADNGNFTATGNITAFSDERLKDDIETLDGSKVLDMRGVSYTKDGKAGSGVIAQELEKVAPELVMTNEKEDGMKSVAYGNLVGYLIEAVKDQQKQIDELKAQINDISN